MKVEVQMQGLEGVIDTLKRLPPEVVSKRGGPVRRALAKGAKLIRDESRKALQRSIDAAGKTGITETTGFTAGNVIMKRRRLDYINGERYIVTVRPKKHPSGHKYRKRTIQTNDIAFIMEQGSAKHPALPWLRPTFASRAEEAIRMIETTLIADIDKIVKKLAAQNGAR